MGLKKICERFSLLCGLIPFRTGRRTGVRVTADSSKTKPFSWQYNNLNFIYKSTSWPWMFKSEHLYPSSLFLSQNYSTITLSDGDKNKSRFILSHYTYYYNYSNSNSCCLPRFLKNKKMTTQAQATVKEIKLLLHGKISISDSPVSANINADNGAEAQDLNEDESKRVYEETVSSSSRCLLNGGVLAVPTDTIYGIAGLAQDNEAVERIYDIKQRNYEKPVAISVGKIDDIYKWSKVTVPRQLLTDLLPGPVTVIFERSAELNPALNPQASLVGIRIPNHVFMKDLAIACNGPIALTSANVSGDKSCLHVEEFQHLWPLLDLVVNGGKLNDSEEARLGSTVVDLSVQGTYRIIRNGSAYAATRAVLQDRYKLKEAGHL